MAFVVKVTCPCRQKNTVLESHHGGDAEVITGVAPPAENTTDIDITTEIVSATGGAKKVPEAVTLDAEAQKALEGLTTTTGECAENIGAPPGTHCSSCKVVAAIQDFAGGLSVKDPGASSAAGVVATSPLLPTAATPAAEAVRSAATALKCNSESCIINHPDFQQYVVRRGLLSPKDLESELELRYKAAGPRNSTALLSNYNIDETLRRWARVYADFYPCPFAMMDFDSNGDVFGSIDVGEVLTGAAPVYFGPALGTEKRRAATFGCVLNTDISSGPGKHWVAVFVDARKPGGPWTVEYFNSAGNPPPKAVIRWMERTRERLKTSLAALIDAASTSGKNASSKDTPGKDLRDGLKGLTSGATIQVDTVAVTDVDHQESQTECGLYALYYIRRRLEGTPYTFFFDRIVPDDAMTAFRAHIFRAS